MEYKFVIVGWYGTETIGDRAILAGIIHLLSKSIDCSFSIKIASLFDFFTERTLLEDREFLSEISEGRMSEVHGFQITNIFLLEKEIRKCDCVIFGGGPLMDIEELKYCEYAFRYAKKKKKKCMVLGCGVGPISTPRLINSMHSIINKSDLIIFRDKNSCIKYKELGGGMDTYSAIDPAVFAANYYREHYPQRRDSYVAINFRDVRGDMYDDTRGSEYIKFFLKILKRESEKNNKRIILVPMHSFVIGGDDRYFYSELLSEYNAPNIATNIIPMSLKEVFSQYRNAEYCYGMRFHSVLLQTVLNGNNIVLDYTNPETGKTISLLEDMGVKSDFIERKRYLSLVRDNLCVDFDIAGGEIFVEHDLIDRYMSFYIKEIKRVLYEGCSC